MLKAKAKISPYSLKHFSLIQKRIKEIWHLYYDNSNCTNDIFVKLRLYFQPFMCSMVWLDKGDCMDKLWTCSSRSLEISIGDSLNQGCGHGELDEKKHEI